MSPSQYPHASILHSGPTPLVAVIEIARANTSGPFNRKDHTIGVGAVLSGPDGVTEHWMAGYASAEDFGRAAMIQCLLSYRPGDLQLYVHCRGLDMLNYIPEARARSVLGKNNQLIKGYDVLEPVQWAQTNSAWNHLNFNKGSEPAGHLAAKRLAKHGLEVSLGLINEFDQHRAEHPDWHMLKSGVTLVDSNGKR